MKTAAPSTASTYSGRNLHGQVVHELGKRIVGGACPPGEALPNEEELCRELGVSRTALRESVKVLAAKGLVESRPRIGTRVRASESWNLLDPDVLAWRCATLPDAQFVLHLTEMREIIEPSSAALAARNRTPAQLRQIEDAHAKMAAATTLEQWVAADLAFHSAILTATNNPLLRPRYGCESSRSGGQPSRIVFSVSRVASAVSNTTRPRTWLMPDITAQAAVRASISQTPDPLTPISVPSSWKARR